MALSAWYVEACGVSFSGSTRSIRRRRRRDDPTTRAMSTSAMATPTMIQIVVEVNTGSSSHQVRLPRAPVLGAGRRVDLPRGRHPEHHDLVDPFGGARSTRSPNPAAAILCPLPFRMTYL